MSSTVRRLAILGIASLVLGAVAAAPASAGTLAHEHYSWEESGEWDGCGPTYEYEAYGSGLFTLKPGHAGDPTPYLTDNYEWHWINRNPANGKWFAEDGQAIYKDVKITNLHGTVYRFIAEEAGSPYTITTSDGAKIIMDRGLLRYQFDVDTKGDDDLDNDEFIDGTDVLLADRGAHPVWHMTGDDYCAVVADLLE
jgi:hypothetical protein